MHNKQTHLLRERRFFPLFITQLFQALNDCIFKSAMAILIAYRLTSSGMFNEDVMVALAGGIFIVPFFLFSATAGQLSDKFEKASLIRIIKFLEILFVLMGSIGFFSNNIMLLFSSLFLIGIHSAFFGPIKYAILPDHLHENELIRGNALIEASTFLAILFGTMIGTKLILGTAGTYITSILLFTIALTGWIVSFYIPRTQPASPQLKINPNIFRETWNIVQYTHKNRDVFLAILGISWFWLVGATFLQQFVTYAKDVVGANTGVVALFQMMFSIGIAVGSLLCNKLVGDEINAKYVPLGVLGMTVFITDLVLHSGQIVIAQGQHLLTTKEFLLSINNWHLLADTLFLAVCGGLYVVPLYAILQARCERHYRSRTIACNNIINSLFIVAGAVIAMLLLSFHLTVTQVFMVIGILNTIVAIYICKLLPEAFVKSVINWLLKAIYNVEVRGLENYNEAGDRVVIIANHTSLLDIILLLAFLPDKFTIAVNKSVSEKWWVKPFTPLAETYPIDPTNPMAIKSLVKEIQAGKKCLIFPEGRLTTTGSLMKVYEGPGLIANKANAMIVPIRIEGAQYTCFSRLKGKVRMQWFPQITLTILKPRRVTAPDNIDDRDQRRTIAMKLYNMMTEMMFESSNYHLTLFSALLDAKKVHGGSLNIIEDIQRKPINYNQFIARAYILGKQISKINHYQEHIGIMLPTSNPAITTFFAAHAYGRIPAMINFSSGIANILSACKTAKLRTVYTSQTFITNAKLENIIEALNEAGITVIYLESLMKKVSLFAKIRGLITSKAAPLVYRKYVKRISPNDPAVILFTSGSEGQPKGVMLSHANILANCYQMLARVDFNPRDIMFNALPIFHCFGLTVGSILPIVSGIKAFFYPSPLHYRVVPELVYDTDATVFFSTDTFLSGYARYAHPYDFYSVRYIFSGAEKLREDTAKLWSEKFGIRVFEGYGVTETAPALTVNTSMQNKPGTVGTFLPNIEYKLEKVNGIEEGGRLFVRGPNIMLGYLRHDAPDTLEKPKDGWHDTGDIVNMTADGFITIKGRAKRFAKLAGEMISLTAVEMYISKLWPNYHHAIVSIPNEKKGEQIILLTDYHQANREDLIAYVKQNGLNELSIPKKIIIAGEMPILTTGKIDYKTVQHVVEKEA